jgi:hypothetical protein
MVILTECTVSTCRVHMANASILKVDAAPGKAAAPLQCGRPGPAARPRVCRLFAPGVFQ